MTTYICSCFQRLVTFSSSFWVLEFYYKHQSLIAMDLVSSIDVPIACVNDSGFTSLCHTVHNSGFDINLLGEKSANVQKSQQTSNYLDQYQCPSPSLSDIDFGDEILTSMNFSTSFLDQILQENSNSTDSSSEKITPPSIIASCDAQVLVPNLPPLAASPNICPQVVETNSCSNSHLLHQNHCNSSYKNLSTVGSGQKVSVESCYQPVCYDGYSYDHSTAYHSAHSSGYYSCLMDSIESPCQEMKPTSQFALQLPDINSNMFVDHSESQSIKSEVSDMLKPKESFIALVAKAILSTADNSMVLSEIYQWILDNYPYFLKAKCAWQSSVRHSLSVNECFVKGKRAKNGRGFVWSIHPLCIDSFRKGDFDRRTARRIVQHSTRAIISAVQELEKITQTVHSRTTYQPQNVTNQRYQACAIPQSVSSTPIRNDAASQYYSNISYNSDSMNCSPISRNTLDYTYQNFTSPSAYGYY